MFVVTVPPSAEKKPRAFALAAKRAGAQVLEIRGDLTPNIELFSSPLPLLLSPRGRALPAFQATYLDSELDEKIPAHQSYSDSKRIVSFHDYEGTPGLKRLKQIALELATSQPWCIKIATFIQSYHDLHSLQSLQLWLKKKGVRFIVLGMGPLAHLSRLGSPLQNVFTYAALDGYEHSAPGQLPLSLYRCLRGRKNPKLFGILGGQHITASMSPYIHNELFRRHKIDALYSVFPTDHFASTLRSLRSLAVCGVSVTAPYKTHAFKAAAKRSPEVRSLGVANTLVWKGQLWEASNSDWYGILHGYPILKSAKTIAILGAGGAVPSLLYALRSVNPRGKITVYARDTKKAAEALKKTKVRIAYISDSRKTSADVVVCAVSSDVTLSFPNPASKNAVALDLRYGKTTKFLAAAKKAGYRTVDGVPMLIHQALMQFSLFTGQDPLPTDAAYLQRFLSSLSHGK